MALFIGGKPVVGAPGDVDSEARNPLGTEATDELGNVYKYLPGAASTVAGSWVLFTNTAVTAAGWATALITETGTGPVAIATGATVAGTYGWYLVRGWYSGALAGSMGTIVSGGGTLQAASDGHEGKVVLGVPEGLGVFIYGAFSYSGQPDSDSAAAGTPGADQIVVFINRPFATENFT